MASLIQQGQYKLHIAYRQPVYYPDPNEQGAIEIATQDFMCWDYEIPSPPKPMTITMDELGHKVIAIYPDMIALVVITYIPDSED